MPFAELSTDATLFYEHLNPESDRLPVLVIHGFLGTGRKDLGHVLDWLADTGYEVIAPSLRGYGESKPKPRRFPFQFYRKDAKDILALLDALEIEKCHLLGYSDGGEVALTAAGMTPERFASVATIGSIGYQGPNIRSVVMNFRAGSQRITQAEIETHGIENADRFAAEWVRAMVQLVDSGGDVAVSLAKNMTMPVLMMLGEKDTLNPREYAKVFMKDVANGRIEMFDAGHPIHDEQTERFKAVFLTHLQSAENN